MQFASAAKKQAVLSHGVIDAGSGENQSIIAAEAGDHDRRRHEITANGAEHLGERSGSNAVFGGVSDSMFQDSCAVRSSLGTYASAEYLTCTMQRQHIQ